MYTREHIFVTHTARIWICAVSILMNFVCSCARNMRRILACHASHNMYLFAPQIILLITTLWCWTLVRYEITDMCISNVFFFLSRRISYLTEDEGFLSMCNTIIWRIIPYILFSYNCVTFILKQERLILSTFISAASARIGGGGSAQGDGALLLFFYFFWRTPTIFFLLGRGDGKN